MDYTKAPNLTPFMTITGDLKIDRAIGKWIKGLEDRTSVEVMILNAQVGGLIPWNDSEGRHWTPAMILGYALMVTPRR